MSEGQVDVIVINWNGKQFLGECLESILNQSYQNTNVIVVDNGSTDGSVQFVSGNFKNVTLIDLQDNRGFTGANNVGIESGAGEFVALLNNDAVAHRDWVRESVNCLGLHQDAGFCASKIVDYHRRDILDAAGDMYTKGGVNAKRGFGRAADLYTDSEYVFGACAAAAVYRRRMLDEIGYFDDDFFIMCEDVDLSFRAQLAGYRCIYCPEATVYHKTHGSIGTMGNVFSYYGQRNLEYVYVKNMPFRLLVSHLPAHMIYNLSVLFYFTMRRQLLSFLKAKVDFLLSLPVTLRKRSRIQKNRRVPTRYVGSLITRGWFVDKLRRKLSPGLTP